MNYGRNKEYLGAAGLAAFLFLFAACRAGAAVSGTSTALTSNAANTVRANILQPVLSLTLATSTTPPENLNSVTIQIATTTSATPTALSTSSFSMVGLMQDTDHDGLPNGGDAILATTTVTGVGTSTVMNISTTTPASGLFFVFVQTASTSTFTDNGFPENASSVPQKFVVMISTSTGVVASSTNATLAGATTTAAFTADIHSQVPDTTKISPSYNSSGGTYSIADRGGAGGVGGLGVLNIYNSSTSTTPFATTTISQSGQISAGLGTVYLSSVWLDAVDAAGNATSSRVQYNLSSYKPTVTSFNAFIDRLIINTSQPLRGDQASNCSSYLINSSAPSCGGGPTAPYIEFKGNQLAIKNLSLSGTVNFSVSGLIQDTNPDQFPLSFSTSSVPVQTASVPTISSVTPSSGQAGNTVTIAGANFGAATGTVFFSGGFSPTTGPLQPIPASTTAWSDTSLTATVPTGAQAGPVQVVASNGMTSDMNQNTFFSILGNAYFKLALSTSSSPITTSTNMVIFIGDPSGGMHTFFAGDASGTVFNATTYVYTVPSVSQMGFAWAYDSSGANLPAPGVQFQSTSTSTPQVLVLASSTAYSASGTITVGASCVPAYQSQFVSVMAMPQGSTIPMGPGGVQPSFFKTNGSCQASYAVALPAQGTYTLQAHLPPGTPITGLLDPAGQTVVIATSTPSSTVNFTFAAASRSIYGQVVGGNGSALPASQYNNLWVFAYQPAVAGGQGAAAQPNSSGYFRLYANSGAYKLSVGGPQMPTGVEQDVLVTTSTAFDAAASTPVVTLTLAPPTSYLSGYVKDSTGNAISGADVFSYCANGPGGGHSSTDSQGFYKMFVPACSNYHVNGFSSTYGQFTEQSNISVTSSGSATVNFTINSSNFVTVSGTVSQNGSLVSGANVWITQGQFGPGVAGGQTNSSGAFSLMVKSGLSNLYVHAAVMGQGELANQQLASGGTVSSNQTSIGLSSSVATLTVQLSPGNTFSQVFLGAHSPTGGGFTNTAVATSSSYDTYQIQVPYAGGGTVYAIDGGIPNFGPVPATTTTVTGNATISINLSSINFYTVSGNVSGNFSGSYVWAGGSSGGGGTQVNSSTGAFSMQLRQGVYDIGVNSPGYVGSLLVQQNISTTTAGLSLSLTQSTSTISGTVYYSGSAVSGVRVWADNSSNGWVGGQSDGNGAFSLSVSPGAWRVHALSDGYQLSSPLLVTAPASGLSVNLSAVNFTPTQQLQSISPSAGGVVQTSNTKVQIPQGALGSGSTNVQVSITDTMSTPQKKGAKVIGNGENISASYASGSSQGQAVSQLSSGSTATLQLVLTKAQLTAGGVTSLTQAQQMQIGYDDTTSNAWTYLPTTVTASSSDGTWANLQSVTFSGSTSHFSTYAPVLPTSGSAPSTPSGVSASAGNGQVTISWGSVSGAASYDVYRQSGSNYAFLASTTAVSYTDTGLTNGTSYSYEVSALDSNSNESAASSPVSATPAAPSTPSTTTNSVGGAGGGGGAAILYGCTDPKNPRYNPAANFNDPTLCAASSLSTTTAAAPAAPAAAPSASAAPAPSGTSLRSQLNALQAALQSLVSEARQRGIALPPGVEKLVPSTPAAFSRNLSFGSKGKDVEALQKFLISQSKGPAARKLKKNGATALFGALTRAALAEFQKSVGISPANGYFGPRTRAYLKTLEF